jgi:glyoxalase family protein
VAYPILGLHHVTATVDRAQADLDFYRALLGLRLVKKTVNFDNHHVYHFYYGDERGTPGTIWTTFPYAGHGVRIGSKGAGQITVTSFSVPSNSLDFWATRFSDQGLRVDDRRSRWSEDSIVIADPSGLAIELVANDDDPRTPWARTTIAHDSAVRGLHSVSLTIRSLAETIAFMTEILGFQTADESEDGTRLAVNGTMPGHLVDLIHAPDATPAVNGLGTVHHVAFAIADAEAQQRLRDDLIGRGHDVTPVMDRQYFQSIYFREPGGVLFEVATMRPGFTVDEPVEALGQELKLPPWEELNRPAIERGLPPIDQQESKAPPLD